MSERRRVWPKVLSEIVHRPSVTTADVVGMLNGSKAQAAQMLRQLATWGYLRRIGFAPTPSGRGRRMIVYEVTPKAEQYLRRVMS